MFRKLEKKMSITYKLNIDDNGEYVSAHFTVELGDATYSFVIDGLDMLKSEYLDIQDYYVDVFTSGEHICIYTKGETCTSLILPKSKYIGSYEHCRHEIRREIKDRGL